MKLFAIVTAGLMAVAGSSYYFFGTSSHCSKGTCGLAPAPVATSGGCCSTGDVATHDCCALQEECCALQEACCTVATSVAAKKSDCCAAKEDCCLVSAACCTAVSVKAAAKPIEIESCCGACVVTPTRTVSDAAKSIASVK